MVNKRYEKRLLIQRRTGLHRDPPEISGREGKHLIIGGRRVLNFASNDYLGLGISKDIGKKVARNFLKYNASSSSSRLVSGNYSVITGAEREYARYFGYKDALFFPSGYQANIAVLSTLFERGDTLVFDKHIHASSVKGMVLSGADFRGYNHSSMSHLKKRLKENAQDMTAVITESLFSMDGDLLDTGTFGEMKRRFGFLSIVDEAHAFGALGEKGRGIAGDVADIAVGTFGKALGFFGAFVLLPEGLKEYLFNFSSPLIYTTALPEAHAASAIDLLQVISQGDDLRRRLRDVSRFMKARLVSEGFSVTGDAHILSVKIGDETRAAGISNGMLKKDVFVLPVRYPTVPVGRSLLRIGMTTLITEEDVEYFINALKEAYGG